MTLPSGQKIDFKEEWLRYYSGLITDEAKVQFLLMLKERVFVNHDREAAEVLPGLAERWVKEQFR